MMTSEEKSGAPIMKGWLAVYEEFKNHKWPSTDKKKNSQPCIQP